jgi:hypothetical protein
LFRVLKQFTGQTEEGKSKTAMKEAAAEALVSCYSFLQLDKGRSIVAPVLSLALYSPKCVEGEFCELRHNGVLGSSARTML